MRTLSILCMFFLLLVARAMHVPAFAQSQAVSDVPLMVIRYNQKRVYYDKQLYNAVRKALDIKPSVRFSIVSFVPQYGRERQQEQQRQNANRDVAKLANTLTSMGIPKSRIAISKETVSDARHHEIYLYVD